MASILDPPILTKVAKMKERVCWQHPAFRARHIDQTRLILEDGRSDDREFSFLVIGDSGSGPHPDHHPQRRIAERMVPHLSDCRFLLHTGDVVYQVGSSEQYPDNFIKPYREWLVGGDRPERIAFDGMVFSSPFLAVPGNHDYYNLPRLYSILVQLTRPLRQLLKLNLNPNVGWRGSGVGDTYARAFLDYLRVLSDDDLATHLDRHYGPWNEHTLGLRYRPGQFTRLPNRYYTFRYGGIDFFALDSSTFNDPALSPQRATSAAHHQRLLTQREAVQRQQQQVRDEAMHLQRTDPHAQERLDDLQAKVEQFDEMLLDIEKQVHPRPTTLVDTEQLLWLRDGLIASWQDKSVRGRVLFFHHPPYVTENTKWAQGQTMAIRQNLRWVLDQVAAAVPGIGPDRPPVNLVLNGHAHCFEYLKTEATGYADSHVNWVVCGGSGLSLRRQRPEGTMLYEPLGADPNGQMEFKLVAKSQLYLGLTGHKTERRRPYSFVRIDVTGEDSPRFVLTPYISERYHQGWDDYAMDPLVLS
ncbi:metallophosphoesterase family protein [Nodosilinea sp. PGN35]|uniref:metallophosphoesterase family protein n=1 Tax=Nodosilinea sp. PGN35 TaxID=3020489 RepID=UPI0023B2E499|nr:metallophosphoesterase [Nodosilinea sp. TSF1-S3]MDF0364981.1 metallophosphoesterase [Nodosilinea sp. TSF1-S3]